MVVKKSRFQSGVLHKQGWTTSSWTWNLRAAAGRLVDPQQDDWIYIVVMARMN
jgi:hypothetical protein